jgi:hypothetical protein
MFEQFVSFPPEQKAAFVALFALALGFVFTKIPYVGQFLNQYRDSIALALGSALFAWLEGFVPDAFATVAILAGQLVLAIFAAFGVVVGVKNYLGHYGEKGITTLK